MVTLLILDGFGLNSSVKGNAIKVQGTPNLKSLGNFPYTTLKASGEAVGRYLRACASLEYFALMV